MPRRFPRQEFITSGRLIARLTHGLAKAKDWTMEETMRYIGKETGRSSDMVYRWQEGHTLPKPEVVAELAKIGQSKGGLSREWCEELLEATRYPDPITLVQLGVNSSMVYAIKAFPW